MPRLAVLGLQHRLTVDSLHIKVLGSLRLGLHQDFLLCSATQRSHSERDHRSHHGGLEVSEP